jgi:citronellol/citronellal dehydrogenase
MAKIDATALLRPGLLDGLPIVLAAPAEASRAAGPELAVAVLATCRALGAVVRECPLVATGAPQEDDAEVDAALAAALAELGGARVLVLDASGLPLGTGAGGLLDALEAAWRVTRAVANAAFIDGEGAGSEGGKIIYLAPRTFADGARGEPGALLPHAEAARAGLENLARTLSIEWARYGVTPVTIAPGPSTTPEQIAGVVAYLASPAGDYFSGCELELRGPG